MSSLRNGGFIRALLLLVAAVVISWPGGAVLSAAPEATPTPAPNQAGEVSPAGGATRDGEGSVEEAMKKIPVNSLRDILEANPPKYSPDLVKFLTVSVLIFGVLVLGLMTFLILRDKNPSQILRLFTVPTVIVAAVFLVVTGFTNEQITPVVGLLGTLVGYILGAHSVAAESLPASKSPGDESSREGN